MGRCSVCGASLAVGASFCGACVSTAAPWATTDALAPIGRRLLGSCIDIVIVYVGLLLGPIVLLGATTPEPTLLNPNPPPPEFTVLVLAAALLAALAYPVVFLGSEAGQSPGMRLAGVRVLRVVDGRPLGCGRAALRLVGHVGDLWAVGLLWALWDPQRQTLRDKIAGTVVVRSSVYPPQDWLGALSWSGDEFERALRFDELRSFQF